MIEKYRKWVEEYSINKGSAIDNTIQEVHKLVCEFEIDKLDNLFKELLNEEVIYDLSITLLLVTYPARNHLIHRSAYYEYVFNDMAKTLGRDRATEELITLG